LRDPDVSVIIPCFNEKDNIEETVERIIAQDFSGNIEIIVVDDGSTDDTYSIVSDYIKENSIPKNRYVTVLRKKNDGKPSAINFGVNRARGKYCVCSDGDTKLDKSAIRLLLEKFSKDGDVGIVAGMVHIDNQNKIFTRIQEVEYILGQLQYRLLQSEEYSVLLKDCKSLSLVTTIPAYILYDSFCTWISTYLFIRYLLGIGISFKYGQKWVYAK